MRRLCKCRVYWTVCVYAPLWEIDLNLNGYIIMAGIPSRCSLFLLLCLSICLSLGVSKSTLCDRIYVIPKIKFVCYVLYTYIFQCIWQSLLINQELKIIHFAFHNRYGRHHCVLGILICADKKQTATHTMNAKCEPFELVHNLLSIDRLL